MNHMKHKNHGVERSGLGTTKGTKITKVEFDKLSNRAIGCAIAVHRLGYSLDVQVEYQLIVALKSVERLLGIHDAQLLTFLKMAEIKIGLLINFSVARLKEGIQR